jgi:hypothetical protein
MADKKTFYRSIDLQNNEIKNVIIENLSTEPSDPRSGQIYYNTNDNNLYLYNGSTFEIILSGLDDSVTSASFSTDDGVLTLYKNDSSTITLDLDGRYFETSNDTLDDIAEGSSKKHLTLANLQKLNNIEDNADVTDYTNVQNAGAVMNSDNSTSSMSFVVDEDNMVSNSDTKIPTQQSVKSYIDNQVNSAISSEMTYRGGYNASSNTPNLDSSPTGIKKGDMYTVTTAGTFYSNDLIIGDVLISEIDNPSSINDWTVISNSLDAANIKILYESNNNTNAFTDAEQSKLNNISITQSADLDQMQSDIATNNLKTSNATHTGDVTGSTALTLQNNVVTNSKLSNISTGTVKGRTSSGTGQVQDLDIDTTLKSALNLVKGDVGLSNVQNINTAIADNIQSGTLNEARLPNGINSNKIADGTISNTEFQHLNGVSSNIQTQLNSLSGANANVQANWIETNTSDDSFIQNKPTLATSATTDTTNANNISSGTLNSSRLPTGIDAANIADGTISNTEFQYLDGVSSNIQTQLNSLSGGNANVQANWTETDTNDDSFIQNKPTLAASATTDTTNAANIANGTVSNTEFQYLNGVTSSIQSQFDTQAALINTVESDLPLVNDTTPELGGDLDCNGNAINDATSFSLDNSPFNTASLSSPGQMIYNNNKGTVHLRAANSDVLLGQTLEMPVKNSSGSTINKGSVVYQTGVDTSLNLPTIGKFIANGSIQPIFILGVTTSDITNNSTGKVIVHGHVFDINTSAYSAAAILYSSQSTSGGMTASYPTSGLELAVATVVEVGSLGQIFVSIKHQTNNANNLIFGTVAEARLPSGINATKIGTGNISNTEFDYLNGVTSNIQTQLNNLSGGGSSSSAGIVTVTGHNGNSEFRMQRSSSGGAGHLGNGLRWQGSYPDGGSYNHVMLPRKTFTTPSSMIALNTGLYLNGLGASSAALYVNGTASGSGTWQGSDKRIKYNIKSIDDALNIISKLEVKQYEKITKIDDDVNDSGQMCYTPPTESEFNKNKSDYEYKKEYGFFAQQIQEIEGLDFLVKSLFVECKTNLLGLDYNSIFSIAVKAIQELSRKVNKQQEKIESLENTLENFVNNR